MLGSSYRLGDGSRIRLRVAAPSDGQRIAALLAQTDGAAAELAVQRLVRFDPRRRVVVCATALIDGAEVLVGVGAIELAAEGHAQRKPDVLLIAPEAPAGTGELLGGALIGRAQALARGRAA